jgi:hypothetical protein
VKLTCPKCRGTLTAPPDWAAEPLKCPTCRATVRVRAKPAPVAAVAGPAAFADLPVAAGPPAKRSAGPVLLLFGLLAVGGLVGGAFALGLVPLPAAVTAPTAPEVRTAPTAAAERKVDVYPRRLLVVSVSRYLYCNRLTPGVGWNTADLPTEVGKRLAFDWRVPQDAGDQQLTVLSDTAPDPRPMLRPVIEQTLADFCRTSRPQDRVLVYFGGHATETDGKVYLVPADGDLSEPAGLIPLADVWAKLQACPAAQKAIIFDVCRLNEDGDRVRPGGEPMTPSLEKLLLAAPPGVQAVVTCSAGQQTHEFRRTPADLSAADVTGSLFLSALRHVAAKGKLTAAVPKPDDPLPVAEWVEAAAARVAAVCEATGRSLQTPKVAGAVPSQLAAADPAAPPAEAVKLPTPPPGLPPTEVAKLTAAIALPPIRERPTAGDDDMTLPFAVDRMAAYTPAAADTPARTTAVAALDEIRKLWVLTTGEDERGGLRTEFAGDTDDALKAAVARDQETPARLILALEDRDRMLTALTDSAAEDKSPYWRATFDFARAQVKARLAFMHEYNLLLGNIRTDSLPARDPKKGETGLQLVSVAKLKSKKDVQDIADAARELFAVVAKEHAGTPWAVAARRASAEALGLEWRPFAPGGKPKAD